MPLHPVIARRPRMIAVAALVGVAGLALAGWSLAPRGAAADSRVLGPELAIVTVPPVEPDIQPGEVMEVGTLTDGFDKASLQRRAEPGYVSEYGYDGLEQPTYVATPAEYDRYDASSGVTSGPASARSVSQPVVSAGPWDRPTPDKQPAPRSESPQGSPLAQIARSFGFDRPPPDYAAERAARREAMEARLRERQRAWGPPPDQPVQNSREIDREAFEYSQH